MTLVNTVNYLLCNIKHIMEHGRLPIITETGFLRGKNL